MEDCGHNHYHDHAIPDCNNKKVQHRIPILDRFPWQEQVSTRKLKNPPISPRKGERFLIPENLENISPWKSYENYIVWYDGYNWHYDMPSSGWKAYVIDEQDTLVFNGTGWVSDSAVSICGHTLKIINVNNNVGSGGKGNTTAPLSTISRAIDEIIINKDNSQIGYKIELAPGKYNEIIALENNNLFNLVISGTDKDQVFVNTNKKSIQSTINNSNLSKLIFSNITFDGTVFLQGHLNNSQFSNIVFDNCRFKHNIMLANINSVRFVNNTEIRENHLTIENVGYCYFDETVIIDPFLNDACNENHDHIHRHYLEKCPENIYNGHHHDHCGSNHHKHHHCTCGCTPCSCIPVPPSISDSSFTIITDPVSNHPSYWTDKTQVEMRCNLKRSIDWKTLNRSSILFKLQNGKYGIIGHEFHIPKDVYFIATNSFLYGNYHLNGMLVLENSHIHGHVFEHNCSKFIILGQPARQIYNDSAIPGKNVKEALDYLFKNGGSGSGGSCECNHTVVYDNDYKDILLTIN